MPPTIEVCDYTIQELRRIFAAKSNATLLQVNAKSHTHYFETYFQHYAPDPITIVVENAYVDRDFLEDYTAYYARCFAQIPRVCTRIHFFKTRFTQPEFLELLRTGPTHPLHSRLTGDTYLGFVVVRPLPSTFVGRTCLRHYDPAGRRHYPIVQECTANLHGIRLKVQSIPFQEQDRVTAACATSALWSAFHGTGMLFQHHIPSPAEITSRATEHSNVFRRIPNSGLSLYQMANAVRHVGLDPLYMEVSSSDLLRGFVYPYVAGKLPVLLVGSLYDPKISGVRPDETLHAVVVTGYSTSGPLASSADFGNLQLQSQCIDKFYCHDDQVGPFARMEFDEIGPPGSLSTSWPDKDNVLGLVRFLPYALLVPLYHKIRVTAEEAIGHVGEFQLFLRSINASRKSQVFPEFQWDVRLRLVNEYKSELFQNPLASGDRSPLLIQSMPKYLWVARASEGGKAVLDLVFDATGIGHTNCGHCIIEWSTGYCAILNKMLQAPSIRQHAERGRWWNTLRLLI